MSRILISGLAMLCMGCATNAAQETALLLVDRIDAYERQVNEKITGEQRFYAEVRKDLKDSARRQARRGQQAEYLARLTELTDQAVVRDKGLQLSVLQQFLRESNERARTANTDLAARRAELEAVYRVNFELLSNHSRDLRNARAQLLQLARDKSTKDQLRKFLQASAREAHELQKKIAAAQHENTSGEDGGD